MAHKISISQFAGISSLVALPPTYRVDTLPGATAQDVGTKVNNLGSVAINKNGVVAGTETLTAEYWWWSPLTKAVYGDPLPIPTSSQISMAFGINEAAHIVGAWSPRNTWPGTAFLFNGTLVDLGERLGTVVSVGADINDAGIVVGYRGDDGAPAFGACRAFTYNTTGGAPPKDLGVLSDGHAQSMAVAINNSGQVVGVSRVNYYTDVHGFIHDGTMRDLGLVYSMNDINDVGQVVGARVEPDQFPDFRVAFRCDTSSGKAVFQSLGLPPGTGTIGSEAFGINNRGDIVGCAFGSVDALSGLPDDLVNWHACITFHDSPSKTHDLNNYVAKDSGWRLLTAYGINDMGQIVGQGTFQGALHAYLLTPLNYSKLPYRDESDPLRRLIGNHPYMP